MARPNQDAIDTFISFTGSSEAVALRKLEEHGGNLNDAVNAYFSEVDRAITHSTPVPARQNDFMDIDDPIEVASQGPLSRLAAALNPFSILDDPDFHRSFLYGRGTADFSNCSPRVSHPREVREIPIEFKDGNDQSGHSGSRPIVEDVTGSINDHGPEIHGTVTIDDEDDKDIPIAPAIRSAPSAPQSDNVTDFGDDIEEEMLKAAIEASKREAEGGYSNRQFEVPAGSSGSRLGHGLSHPEDVQLACAVSMSLKTAEKEKSSRGRKGMSKSRMEDRGRVPAANGRQGFSSSNKATSSQIEVEAGNSSVQEEADVIEQPLVKHRSRRFTSGASETAKGGEVLGSQPSSPEPHDIAGHEPHDIAGHTQRNGNAFHSEEWGGISSEEHDDAVMLEAALFGGISEGTAYRFAYPPSHGNEGYTRWVPRSPSPTLAAQRLLREQQDDEYHAALQADKEKEIKAREEAEIRRLEEAAAEEAAFQEQKLKEEESRRKMLEEEEFERLLAAKQASLPQEPALDDENAVTLLVRMPDGSRRGRRFLKSDSLQSLFDFIDIGRGVKPGTYRLVRPYPRRAFSDGDSGLSLSELGLTSKQEALFLELV